MQMSVPMSAPWREIDWPVLLRLAASFASSAPGERRVLSFSPAWNLAEVETLRAETQEASQLAAAHGRLPLGGAPDLSAALPRLGAAGAPLDLAELGLFRGFLATLQEVRCILGRAPAAHPALSALAAPLFDPGPLLARFDQILTREGGVRDDASPELAHIRLAHSRARRQMTKLLEGYMAANAVHVQDELITIKRGRFVVPIKASSKSNAGGLVIERSGSGATVFMEPFVAVELNNELADLAASEAEEITRLRALLTAALREEQLRLQGADAALADLDAVEARSRFGAAMGGALPKLSRRIRLEAARHPLLDERLAALRDHCGLGAAGAGPSSADARIPRTGGHPDGHPIVPLTLALGEPERALLISGPNAGGKTVTLKTVGLLAAMAQSGIPIPAAEGSEMPVFDAIVSAIGDAQDVLADLSTFTAALSRWRAILATATGNTLVLVDELGSGTDPLEGAALGKAFLEELSERRSWVLATSHLTALTQFAATRTDLANAAMEFDPASSAPTYRLLAGVPGRSQALAIAAACRLPARLLERAAVHLGDEHLRLDEAIEKLQRRELEAVEIRDDLDRARRAAREEAAEAKRLHAAAAATREVVERQERHQWRARRDEMQRRLAAVIEGLEGDYQARRERGRISAAAILSELEAEVIPAPAAAAKSLAGVLGQAGEEIEVPSLGMRGRLLGAPRDGKVEIEVAGKRLRLAVAEVRASPGPRPDRPLLPPRVSFAAAPRPEEVKSELNLIGRRAGDAIPEIDAYLDRALTEGLRQVRLVHGHGSGRLRRAVNEHLRDHPAVAAHRPGTPDEGGSGATIVILAGD